ncbi:MAG: O-antigen ligase family protein [Thiotrichales bacterium]
MLKSFRDRLPWPRWPSKTTSIPDVPASLSARFSYGGLLLFAFSTSPLPELAGLGLFLMLIGLGLSKDWQVFRRDPIAWTLLALTLYLLVTIAIGWRLFPHRLQDHLTGALYLILFPFMILLVAWVLNADRQRVYTMLAAALGGLLVAIALPVATGQVSWLELWGGERHGLMFSNPIRLGLYTSGALLGLLIWRSAWIGRDSWSASKVLIYLLMMGVLIQALVVSQARAAWVATLIVVPVSLAALWFVTRHGRQKITRSEWSALALIVAILSISIVGFQDVIVKRSFSEMPTIKAAIDGNSVEFDNFGKRYHMWKLGIEKTSERPWLGHGPGSVPEYLANQQLEISHFTHLHNLYLDLLVRVGIIGLVIVMTIFVLLIYAVISEWRGGSLEVKMAIFVLGALALFLIDNLSGYTLSRAQGRFYLALVGGAGYTWFFWRRRFHHQSPNGVFTPSVGA